MCFTELKGRVFCLFFCIYPSQKLCSIRKSALFQKPISYHCLSYLFLNNTFSENWYFDYLIVKKTPQIHIYNEFTVFISPLFRQPGEIAVLQLISSV